MAETNAPPAIRHNIFPKGVIETGVVIEDGYTMVKVPRTPSCLFDALGLAILGKLNAEDMKKNIARTVRANQIFYSKSFLTKINKTPE